MKIILFQKQVEKIYRSNLFVRNDNADGIFYFSAADFPGLSDSNINMGVSLIQESA